MANDNLKKPESDSKVPLTEEEKDKRKKIIILVILILLVLAILIGTAYYFSSREKEEDKPIKDNPGNVVKPDIKDNDKDPEPVVNNNSSNTNNVIVYRPVQKPVQQEPSVQEKPTTVVGNEEDPLISVDFDEETKTINLSGASRYVAKVDERFGDEFRNIVKVKIALNTKYKYEDLEKMKFTIETTVQNGKKNYFLEEVQEDENGNLYFYWLQAVGKGLNQNPKLKINYGDGNVEEYTMDLSDLSIHVPVENGEELASALISEKGSVVIGGVELNLDYKLTVLEEVPVNDENTDDNGTSLAADTENGNTTPNVDTTNKPVDKTYALKITGIDETKENNFYSPDAAIKLGYEGYKYIVAIKLYAPEDLNFTPDSVNKVKSSFYKSFAENELDATDRVTGKNNFALLKEEVNGKTRYYIIVTMAVDGVYPDNNPYVSIDWDGDGNEHGTSRYIFDFSEFDYIEEPKDDVDSEVPETPKDPVDSSVVTGGNESMDDTQNTGNLNSSNQNNDMVSDGDIADDTIVNDEEKELPVDENTNNDQENTDNDDEASSEDTTPSEDIEDTSETTVPSVEEDGDNVSEAIQIIENDVDAL